MRTPRSTSRRRWPFWLLIAAWFCANTPQAAVPHVLEWIKGAEHFSHEAELSRSVAALLAGKNLTPAVHFAAAPRLPQTAQPALPSVTADLKKIDLGLTGESTVVFTSDTTRDWPVFSCGFPLPHVADVPHAPPRVVVTA